MVRNINNIDKGVRVVLALALIALGIFLYSSAGIIGLIIPVAVGGILLTTVFINWCPIYAAIGFSTCPDGQCS